MQKGNLLILSNHYLTFVKDQVEILSDNFSSVCALIRTNPLRIFHSRNSIIDLRNLPKNIDITPVPLLYLPIDLSYKNIGKRHTKSALTLLQKKQFSFDLIHAHFTWSSGYVGARIKERYDVPYVITAHGHDIYSLPFKDETWRKNIKYVLDTADAIITVSRSNLDYIKRLDVNTPVHVITNGFNRELFYPLDMQESRRSLGLPEDRQIVLTVGNLVPVKGHEHLVDAVNAIVKERRDFLCIIVGSGKEMRTLKKRIRVAGLEKHILLVGGRPHDEIPLWMNTCDLFVLPSLNEGNPTVMFESLGCGKPFVGTKVGGIPEIISSEDYGFIVNPADSGDLAEKINQSLDKKWNTQRIIAYGKQFDWKILCNQISEVYSTIIEDF